MKIRFYQGVVFAVACIALSSAALGQGDEAFVRGNQDYAAGKFKEAVADYEQAVQANRPSANLFYNLGNAHFRAGDFGRAILNYERALALEPSHAEAQANLRIARDHARALELQQGWAERLLAFANLQQYSLAAAITFWFGVFALTGLLFARRRSTVTMLLAIVALLICGFLAYTLFAIDQGTRGRALAVVTGSDVSARLATADSSATVLALPPGSEVKILSQRGDWTYAALPNNLRGWIPAKSV